VFLSLLMLYDWQINLNWIWLKFHQMLSRQFVKLWITKKFVYEQKKRDKALKAKSSQVVVKEIRFGPQTDEHDYEFKRKNAEKFLKEGAKLKAFVFFKGRSIIYKDQGQILLLRLAQDLEEHGKVEAMPVLEGKRMIMFIAPKKKK